MVCCWSILLWFVVGVFCCGLLVECFCCGRLVLVVCSWSVYCGRLVGWRWGCFLLWLLCLLLWFLKMGSILLPFLVEL